MENIMLEYEKCHCGKINKIVTITSILIKEPIGAAAACGGKKQAFDCDQKEKCGVLTNSGREMVIDWFECTHPRFLAGSGSVS